jgi:hypothetical protein
LAISSASEARHVFECLGAWRNKGEKKLKPLHFPREVAHFYFATPLLEKALWPSSENKRIPHHRK